MQKLLFSAFLIAYPLGSMAGQCQFNLFHFDDMKAMSNDRHELRKAYEVTPNITLHFPSAPKKIGGKNGYIYFTYNNHIAWPRKFSSKFALQSNGYIFLYGPPVIKRISDCPGYYRISYAEPTGGSSGNGFGYTFIINSHGEPQNAYYFYYIGSPSNIQTIGVMNLSNLAPINQP